jgi:hypothetical protein
MKFAGQVHGLRLIFNILLYDRLAHLAGRRDEVTPRPERRESVKIIELISEDVGTGSLESVNDLVGSVTSICLNEQMYVIGLNRQGGDFPVMFICYAMEYFLQAFCHCAFENRRPSFRAPHEMIFYRVDGVTASAVWFFVDWHESINRLRRTVFRRKSSP